MQRLKAETKTAGGIFLPESSVKELNEAKVLAVGPGGLDREGKRITMGVKEGDRVLIPQVRRSRGDEMEHVERGQNEMLTVDAQYGGSSVKVGEEEYHLFRDSEILPKINE